MKPRHLCFVPLVLFSLSPFVHAADKAVSDDTGNWRFIDIIDYCRAHAGSMTPQEKKKYAEYIIGCQDPETGLFVGRFGTNEYSVKVYWILQTLGYKPKYPLAVCNNPETKDDVSETMSRADFRKWMERMYETYDFYSCGSEIGHFIHPHCINLQNAGKDIQASPYVQEFKKWFRETQKPNGLWNKEGDPVHSCWNGLLKLDSTLGLTKTEVPHADRLLTTIISKLDVEKAYFGAGGCTQHNALNMMKHHCKRNGFLMWEEVFRCMETYMGCLERRFNPQSGYFRPPPGYDQPAGPEMTVNARNESGNVMAFCGTLLKPENAGVIDVKKQHPPAGDKPITQQRIVRLYIQASGMWHIADTKRKADVKAEHERKYGKAGG